MDIIERAARALAKSQSGINAWEELTPDLQENFRRDVRSVLEAIHEPSPMMSEAGAEITRHINNEEAAISYQNDAADTWRLMIETALSLG